MLRKILCNRTFSYSSSNLWCHTNKNSACSTYGEEKDFTNRSESREQKILSELDTVESEKIVLELLESAATYSDGKTKDWATLPYPSDVYLSHESVPDAVKDPTDASIVLFPGQGTINVGMAQKYLHFPKAKELFEYASEIVKYDVLTLCLKGPIEKLNRTDYNQVATVVSSLAALEKLAEERPKVFETCVGVAGYSVGELTALIFAGAISFEEGIKLVEVRGAAMLNACRQVPQGLLSVTLHPTVELHKILEQAKKWAKDNGVSNPVCQVAIYLYTEGKILGGHEIALKYIEANAEAFGLKNVKRLPVSGAFHTSLMTSALNKYKNALDNIHIEEPRVKVYSNYTGREHTNSNNIKKQLIKQVTGAVRWEQCMHLILSRPSTTAFPRIFDVGSQGRLKLILRQTNVQASKSCFVY